jgi:SAM-dependent methyltransferase
MHTHDHHHHHEAHGQAFWDERYAAHDRPFDPDPNPHLERVASDLPPGTALDVGCGEGSDVVWLAARGWHVTAVDISPVALARGRAHDQSGRVTWQQADVLAWTPPAASFDLVTSHFLHFGQADRDVLFRAWAAAVKPGGTLLIVAHHPSDLETSANRWPVKEVFFTAEDVAAALAPEAWEIVEQLAGPRQIRDPHGQTITIHDTVLVARRRG